MPAWVAVVGALGTMAIAAYAAGIYYRRSFEAPPPPEPRTKWEPIVRGTMRTSSAHIVVLAELANRAAMRTRQGLMIVDARRVVWVNPAGAAAVGHSASALVGHDYWEHIHPDDRADGVATVESNQATERGIFEYENRWIAADGSVRHLRWSSSPQDPLGLFYCEVERVSAEAGT